MTKPTVEELLQAIQRLQYETNVSFVQMSADIAIVCAALRERLVVEQLDTFRDFDDHVRKASDKIDRAGFYDEATLMVQLWMLKDEWKRKCQECWNAKPSPEPSDGKE
jgi:hypothetical protein